MQSHPVAGPQPDAKRAAILAMRLEDFHQTILSTPKPERYSLVEEYIAINQITYLGSDDNSTIAKTLRYTKVSNYFQNIILIVDKLSPAEKIKILKPVMQGIQHCAQLLTFLSTIKAAENHLTLDKEFLPASVNSAVQENKSSTPLHQLLDSKMPIAAKLSQDLPLNYNQVDLNILIIISLFETPQLQKLVKSWEDIQTLISSLKPELKIAILKKLGENHVSNCMQKTTHKMCDMETLAHLRDTGFLKKIFEKVDFSIYFPCVFLNNNPQENLHFLKTLPITTLEKFSITKNSLREILKKIEPENRLEFINSFPVDFSRKFCTSCYDIGSALFLIPKKDRTKFLNFLFQPNQSITNSSSANPFLIKLPAVSHDTLSAALELLPPDCKITLFDNIELSSRLTLEKQNQTEFNKILKMLPEDKRAPYIALSNLLFHFEKNIKAYDESVKERANPKLTQSSQRNESIKALRASIRTIINDPSTIDSKITQIIALIKAHMHAVNADHTDNSLFSGITTPALAIAYQKTLNVFPLEMVGKIRAADLTKKLAVSHIDSKHTVKAVSDNGSAVAAVSKNKPVANDNKSAPAKNLDSNVESAVSNKKSAVATGKNLDSKHVPTVSNSKAAPALNSSSKNNPANGNNSTLTLPFNPLTGTPGELTLPLSNPVFITHIAVAPPPKLGNSSTASGGSTSLTKFKK